MATPNSHYRGSSSAAAPYINPSGDRNVWTSYAAGEKIYGSGRGAPNIGPVDPLGYKDRDNVYKARQAAMVKRLKAQQSGQFLSAGFNGSV